jgi:orotidine-5'-phosphate decarboxylase
MSIREKIIVALDFPSKEQAIHCADRLQGTATYLKVGMQLYYAAGPSIVALLKDKGFKVFVDLKVHDIPNTAKGAMESLADLGADMLNVHVAGGLEMMLAAREGLEKGTPHKGVRPLLIGVTQLTSTTEKQLNEQIGIAGSLLDCIREYAKLATAAGLDGVVASPLEVPEIKKECGSAFVTVTPGIRPRGTDAGDQHRITTPKEAFDLGSDYIVIGRPITAASDPAGAMEQILGGVENE